MLDREDVKKVAYLARLELTDTETDAFTGQLAQILDYVEQLNELDTDEVAPTAHAIDMRNVTRPDILETYEHREDVLNSAPLARAISSVSLKLCRSLFRWSASELMTVGRIAIRCAPTVGQHPGWLAQI